MSAGKKSLIAIDARFLGEAGPGRYVKNIIEQLEEVDTTNEYIIYLRPKVLSNINRPRQISEKFWLTTNGTRGRNRSGFFLKY